MFDPTGAIFFFLQDSMANSWHEALFPQQKIGLSNFCKWTRSSSIPIVRHSSENNSFSVHGYLIPIIENNPIFQKVKRTISKRPNLTWNFHFIAPRSILLKSLDPFHTYERAMHRNEVSHSTHPSIYFEPSLSSFIIRGSLGQSPMWHCKYLREWDAHPR